MPSAAAALVRPAAAPAPGPARPSGAGTGLGVVVLGAGCCLRLRFATFLLTGLLPDAGRVVHSGRRSVTTHPVTSSLINSTGGGPRMSGPLTKRCGKMGFHGRRQPE